MTGTDLSDAYENGKYIARAADYPPRWATQARAFRTLMHARGRCVPDIAYGKGGREKFDLFLPESTPRGLMVFVHGGYWRAFDKSAWSHLVAGAVARGFAGVVPGYALCPAVRISAITRQVAAAIAAAAEKVEGPIHLSGHSAGGHLVTRMLCPDVVGAAAFLERVRRVVSISGLHDLRPLLRTDMNAELGLDMAEAAAESVILCSRPAPVSVVAWVGGDERPAFVDQARQLAKSWEHAVMHLDEGHHHFNVIEGLKDPASPLSEVLLEG